VYSELFGHLATLPPLTCTFHLRNLFYTFRVHTLHKWVKRYKRTQYFWSTLYLLNFMEFKKALAEPKKRIDQVVPIQGVPQVEVHLC
jgi:hypothetical protein